MTPVFKKLNLGSHQEIVVLNAPASFEAEVSTLTIPHLHRQLESLSQIHFVLAFVTQQNEVDALVKPIISRSHGDAIIWFAYPKSTSKKYKCDFNRDTGWATLEAAGFETVRAIAIDEDWTGLRFRRREYIKARAR